MMAARVTDMTAHGGMITGPGAPNVLIGNLPACRMGDMHTCPMVTPGVPPVPHVGGPVAGGCPTVLISGLPAARQGDLCVCVGVPSSIVLGCPTVLIGSGASGGNGGGSGTFASIDNTVKALKEGKIKPVEGTETFPVEIQAAIAQISRSCSKETVTQKIKAIEGAFAASGEQKKSVQLTIKDIVEILEEIESKEGYEAARHFSSHLDYGKITDIAKMFVTGENNNPDNDPNQMPTRFMLLYGMDDDKLKHIDEHPDRFEGEEHKINIANLKRGLRLLGYNIADDKRQYFDDEVWIVFMQYLATQPSNYNRDKIHTVTAGENLGSIAKDYGLISWKYLYEFNRKAIGDNPDLLSVGTELQIPQWDNTQGDELIEAKGVAVHDYVNGLRYKYVWVPLSTSVLDFSENPFEFEKEQEMVISISKGNVEVCRKTVSNWQEAQCLVPDSDQLDISFSELLFVT